MQKNTLPTALPMVQIRFYSPKEAQELGWIDKELTTANFPQLDLLLLAIPVDALQEQLANLPRSLRSARTTH